MEEVEGMMVHHADKPVGLCVSHALSADPPKRTAWWEEAECSGSEWYGSVGGGGGERMRGAIRGGRCGGGNIP